MTPSQPKFGVYPPRRPRLAPLLEFLLRLGICRDKLRQVRDRAWAKAGQGCEVMDVESHGVRYRLHFQNNNTDRCILTRPKLHNGSEIFALARGSADDSAFVDVGANTGHYSLQLARLGYSKIIAIEPAPVVLDALSFNVAANGMQEKITIVPLCIGSGEDMELYFEGEDGGGNWGGSSVVRKSTAPITVKSKPLLDVVQGENVRRIGGMKVDVEGFEDAVLSDFFAGAPRELHPKVIVVEDNRDLWKTDIVEKMKDLGYRTEERAGRKRKTGRNLILSL